MNAEQHCDVAVIGAGVFGAWVAYHLQRSEAKVILIDCYGPGNSRASSGGESRIFRLGYGPDELYTLSAIRSFSLWQELSEQVAQTLFHRTGVLWLAREGDSYSLATLATLERNAVPVETLTRAELEQRYPQMEFGEVSWGILEPNSGVLLARQAVRALVQHAQGLGVNFINGSVLPSNGKDKLATISTADGRKIAAGAFVFACGPWLPKLFPELLGELIHVTRQEVFFLGVPSGDPNYSPPSMPTWIDFSDLVYAIPDIDGRGFKIAIDAHGPVFDPDTGDRITTVEGQEAVRRRLLRRVPALAPAPVLETRVCQYENTSTGDFLIDRHPEFDNVWLVGGGSGHGFKHGPAVGEYVAGLISGAGRVEPRFTLAGKERVQRRQVY